MQDVRQRFQGLNDDLVRGQISEDEWYAKANQLIQDGHAEAIRLGQLRAGVRPDDIDSDAIKVQARGVSDTESEFLQGFLADLKNGVYSDDNEDLRPGSFDWRSDLYVGRMRGSANQAFAESSSDDDRWTWELGEDDHCADCPDYAEIIVDVPIDEVFAYPGDGSSECLGNCTCVLVRSDGRRGFERGHLDDDDE